MNAIKTSTRNRMKDILRSLMLLYTAAPEDLDDLDRDKMADQVANQVWKNKRKTLSARYLEQLI